MRLALLAIVCASVWAAARADDAPAARIRVGDGVVDGAVIRPYRNRFSQCVLLSDGSVRDGFVYWTDEVALTNLKGRALLQRTIVTFRARDDAILSTGGALLDARTFAPVSSSETQGVDNAWFTHFEGDGLRAVGLRLGPPAGSAPRFIDQRFSEPAFDLYNAAFGLIYATLPLRAGYSAVLPVASDEKDELEMLHARVVGTETIELAPGAPVRTWIVVDDGSAGRGAYWVANTPPYVFRIRRELALGGRPAVFVWTALPAGHSKPLTPCRDPASDRSELEP